LGPIELIGKLVKILEIDLGTEILELGLKRGETVILGYNSQT
jgi:hypothetical protein